jgi:hypothetical protein
MLQVVGTRPQLGCQGTSDENVTTVGVFLWVAHITTALHTPGYRCLREFLASKQLLRGRLSIAAERGQQQDVSTDRAESLEGPHFRCFYGQGNSRRGTTAKMFHGQGGNRDHLEDHQTEVSTGKQNPGRTSQLVLQRNT